jgi:hypothetical protein
MSPEQLAGKKVDQRSDIFSLGSVFYELVARERPFRGDVTTILYKIVNEDPVAPSLINPAVPGGIDAVIRRALAKEPKERFQTCEELRAAFAEQAARVNVSPAAMGSGAIAVVKAKAQPGPALPGFLLTEPPPRPRNWLPIVFMLLFLGTAAWALYIHSTTGSYPAFVNKLTAGAHQLPHTLRELRPSPSTGQNKVTSPDSGPQSSTKNSTDSSANNAGAQPESTPGQAPAIVLHTAPDGSEDATPSTGTPDGQSASPADGTGTPVMTSLAPAQTAVPPSGATYPASGAASSAIAKNSERSPFSPAGKDSQALAAQLPNKPLRQPVATVDGFTRKNIPELLRVADTAARRGDYRLASYEYHLILKLDRGNARARIGLRLIQSGERFR